MKQWTTTAVVGLAASGFVISAVAQTPLERGRYLMQAVVACGNCHTPQGPKGPEPGKELAGGLPFDEPGFKAFASNITPDADTGIGRWTDAQIVSAIREGKRPDGSLIGPPMPFEQYRHLSDRDAAAIVAYLRSVPPVKNTSPARWRIASNATPRRDPARAVLRPHERGGSDGSGGLSVPRK